MTVTSKHVVASLSTRTGLRRWMDAVFPLIVIVVLTHGSFAGAQERFGGVTGIVTDPSQASLRGATVTITNTQTRAVRTTVTGPDGSFRVLDLDPGRYDIVISLSGFRSVSVTDVVLLLGKVAEVNARLQIGNVNETVSVTGVADQINARSVTVSRNITAEELNLLPKARSFVNVALTSPSVTQGEIEGGLQVNGASGAENAFTVDGVVTNSLVNGKSRQDTVFEYLQEVQVKTAGINAEYGGALGGVISAVTKSGGNVVHGEGHYYYAGSGLSARPVQRLVLSPTDETTVSYVQDAEQPNNRSEFGGSIGGPIVKGKLFYFASASPRVTRRTNNYGYSSGTDQGAVPLKATDNQAFGKLTYTGARWVANASVLATPSRYTGTLSAYNGDVPNAVSFSKTSNVPNITRGWKQDQINGSGSFDLSLGRSALVSARVGYFYDNFADTGIPNTTSVTYNATAVGVPGVPAEMQLPQGTVNTPRAQITSFDTTKRGFVQVDYNQQVRALGTHQFKGGVGLQHTVNDVDEAYPGGYVLLNWGRTFTSSVTGVADRGTYGYYEVDNLGTVGRAGSDIWSLYVQDTWSPTSKVTFDIGLRTEHEVVPSFRDGINAFEFGFGQKLAPRLGATYDPTGSGRMKFYGSWGRYYDWTKYDLARGSYGGDIWLVSYRSLDTLDVYSLNLNNMPGRNLWNPAVPDSVRDRRVPNFDSTDPDIKPMYQDSSNVGFDYQINRTTLVGVHYIHNQLGRTIEDLGGIVNGDEVYVIGNPGEGLGAITPTSSATEPFPTPKAIRKYDAIEFSFNRRLAGKWFASGSYTYSRLYGNYAGLANSDEINTPTTGVSSAVAQQAAGSLARPGGNANRAWDLDEVLADSHGHLDGVVGRLATDRPHALKLYGSYELPKNSQIGLFFYAASGTPISTYVNTLNQIPVFVEGRGDMGRTPVLSRTDLLLAHEIQLASSRSVRLEFNLINVFNQKTATHIFNNLNRGSGLPRASSAIDLSDQDLAVGYDYNALILASPDGANAYDPRYRQPDLFQSGLQGQFSVRYQF